MSLPPLVASRRPLRLGDYDYGAPGAYFLTICARGREPIFAAEAIGIVSAAWQEIPRRFPGVQLDSFVVMPNHVHAVLIITDSAQCVRRTRSGGSQGKVGKAHEPPLPDGHQRRRVERSAMLLPQVVAYFKMNAAKRINLRQGTLGAPVWQRGYYEHVIRGEAELARIRQYIQENPARWEEDPENPASKAYDRRGGSETRPYAAVIHL